MPVSTVSARKFQCGRFLFDLSQNQVLVMGVLNLTPDSFSDGGQFLKLEAALARASEMVEQGASIIDLGAESSRPGAAPVTELEELTRLLPLIEALHRLPVALSIDTRKPRVMLEALRKGADMINDIEGFASLVAEPEALTCDIGGLDPMVDHHSPSKPPFEEAAALISLISKAKTGLCVMHMQGDPLNMQNRPTYRDPVAEICQLLQSRANLMETLGVAGEQIVLDPGIGFGKALEHNQAIMRRLHEFQSLKWPLLLGLSRKSLLGQLTGKPVDQRLAGSLAAALWSAMQGVSILRVHDVDETVDALKVLRGLGGLT